jgi:hypothetical protein
MHLQIEKIILWPRKNDAEPREIEFRTDRINVITGESERGKSALLSIVDYCLGSSRCAIPVGIIREKTLWFGVLLSVGESKLLLARREPGDRLQTSAMYMKEAPEIVIAPSIAKNCTTADVLERLRRLAGLPGLDFEGQDIRRGFRDRPSFRDMVSFNFLPQHIVANPYTLFFKADTSEHQERLRTIFPMVLGAISATTLERRRELKDTERELERAVQALTAQRDASAGWISELRSTYDQAREFGLMPNAPSAAADWMASEFIARLSRVPENFERRGDLTIAEGATEDAARRLAGLRDEEMQLSREITALRRKLLQVEQLDTSTDQYAEVLEMQVQRLAPVSWFAESLKEHEDRCPMCGNPDAEVRTAVDRLASVARQLAVSSSAIAPATRILDRERSELKRDIRERERRLNDVRRRQREWDGTTPERQARRQTLTEISRFVGRLEQALLTYHTAFEDRDILEQIRVIEGRVERLRKSIDPRREQALLEAALAEVARLIQHYALRIGIEAADVRVRLDLTDLTLEFPRERGRIDHLWEIGSAANWMGFHISTYLALHEHFLSLRNSPVPTFLMIDQPSQAFFPDRWPGDPDPRTGEVAVREGVRSNDIDRVKRIFETLSDALRRTRNHLQVIVVDHADQITWRGVSGIHCVARWRDGDALIPANW